MFLNLKVKANEAVTIISIVKCLVLKFHAEFSGIAIKPLEETKTWPIAAKVLKGCYFIITI